MLDIKQGFDKVWHPGLHFKIKMYRLSSHFDILKSFKEGRASSAEA